MTDIGRELVPARETRQAVAALQAHGLTLPQIAHLAGIPAGTVVGISTRQPYRVTRATASAIASAWAVATARLPCESAP